MAVFPEEGAIKLSLGLPSDQRLQSTHRPHLLNPPVRERHGPRQGASGGGQPRAPIACLRGQGEGALRRSQAGKGWGGGEPWGDPVLATPQKELRFTWKCLGEELCPPPPPRVAWMGKLKS